MEEINASVGYIVVKKGYKYQLQIPASYFTSIFGFDIGTDYVHLYPDGRLILAKGYAYDGPSGPTIDGDSNMYAAGGHDGLYGLMRSGLLPKSYKPIADELLHCWCIECGMWKIRAYTWERAVNICGKHCLKPSNNLIYVYPKKYTADFIKLTGISPEKVRT